MAAWEGGYTLEEFEKLDGERQAIVIAAYETKHQIEAVLAYENRPK